MKCDFCEQKATVFLTQLVEGQMKKVCLCESCAQEKGVTDPTGFSLADMLITGTPTSAILGSPIFSSKKRQSDEKRCPQCGFSADDLSRVRRFGCSECYDVFRSEMEMILPGMQMGMYHVGKIPRGHEEKHRHEEKMEDLREKLDLAIQAEDYETAAGLRDELRQLETLYPGLTPS
jgi:protein arginine kinase activator